MIPTTSHIIRLRLLLLLLLMAGAFSVSAQQVSTDSIPGLPEGVGIVSGTPIDDTSAGTLTATPPPPA
ncbi:MAG: hypothetical protein K2I37_04180, partial [Muribaculaceae bacterium]|nr:hypothetical protein [Muribaculaceae bacterium]